MGEAADEADGVRDEDVLGVVELEAAGGGVECGEELVFGEDVGVGELVEQGGLAGVCVSNNGYGGDGFAEAFGALDVAVLDDFLELLLHDRDAFADHAGVGLELGFALAAGAGAAAALAREVGPGSSEAGEGVLHTSELDLEGGFFGVSALGENIDDDLLAVDDEHLGFRFPVALLGGREFVVEDDDVGADLFCVGDDFLDFAGAEEEGRVGFAQLHDNAVDGGDVEVVGELVEFVEEAVRVVVGHAGILDSDEQGRLYFLSVFFEIEHSD